MPLKVVELFGYSPDSPKIGEAVRSRHCPFIRGTCRKYFSTGMPSGLCSASQTQSPKPVICCPQRLYADDYQILRRVADSAFGAGFPFLTGDWKLPLQTDSVIPFGQRMGKELKVKARGASYSFDWILALVSPDGTLKEFVAVEVQTIDTTGSYQYQSWEIQHRHESDAIKGFKEPASGKSSNFNFENVNKRIIPQLITKGHLLRLESLCKKGLFFVCPTPVLDRIIQRLGGKLTEYAMQPGAITFQDYTISAEGSVEPFPLIYGKSLTTTLDQVYLAFSAPAHLPEKDSYTRVVQDAVKARLSGLVAPR
ncbi:MAG: NotI family restriction endonuclease [Verrucomicrobiota bacterium]